MNGNSDSLNAFDSTRSGGHSTSTTSASAIRPRNRRLLSFVEDDEGSGEAVGAMSPQEQNAVSSTLSPSSALATSTRLRRQNASPSPSSSRNPSPIPSKHPSRATSSSRYEDSLPKRSRVQGGSDNQGKTLASGFATDLLDSSWSSLQDLASTVMGSDTSSKQGSGFSWMSNNQQRRKPSGSSSFRVGPGGGTTRPSLPSSWGPSGLLKKPAWSGTKEERDALVQAKKREALLLANGDTMADSQGNYKRRDSGDGALPSVPSDDHDSDALVYVHQVQPDDSLTGVSIRYGCQLAVLRKANGFWPSDTIQSRRTIVLPVNACTIKGRPIHPIQTDHHDVGDLLDDANTDSSSLVPPDQPTDIAALGGSGSKHDQGSTVSSISGKVPGKAPSWKHENWVQIDGLPEPVELGRVPQGTLGYFPRARRKSQGQSKPYSDNDGTTSFTSSFAQLPGSRPSTPDHWQRLPTIGSSTSSTAPSPFREQSTSRAKPSKPSRRHHRHRSSITLGETGGVGTLGRTSIEPGPGPDKLSNFVSSHLPHLRLPPARRHPPSHTSIPDSDLRPPTRISFDSTSSAVSNSSTGLENVGGAIEGWFRKVATRAQSGLNELQQPSQLYNHLGIRGSGDLIELDDTQESSGTAVPPRSTGILRTKSKNTLRGENDGPSSGVPDLRSSNTHGRAANPWEPTRSKTD